MSGSGETGDSGLKQMDPDEVNVTPSLADCATCGMCNKPLPRKTMLWCEDCRLTYCEPCAKQRHAKGALRRHTLKPLATLHSEPLEPAQRMCEYCDTAVALLHCSACEMDFCEACSEAMHTRGALALHSREGFLRYFKSPSCSGGSTRGTGGGGGVGSEDLSGQGQHLSFGLGDAPPPPPSAALSSPSTVNVSANTSTTSLGVWSNPAFGSGSSLHSSESGEHVTGSSAVAITAPVAAGATVSGSGLQAKGLSPSSFAQSSTSLGTLPSGASVGAQQRQGQVAGTALPAPSATATPSRGEIAEMALAASLPASAAASSPAMSIGGSKSASIGGSNSNSPKTGSPQVGEDRKSIGGFDGEAVHQWGAANTDTALQASDEATIPPSPSHAKSLQDGMASLSFEFKPGGSVGLWSTDADVTGSHKGNSPRIIPVPSTGHSSAGSVADSTGTGASIWSPESTPVSGSRRLLSAQLGSSESPYAQAAKPHTQSHLDPNTPAWAQQAVDWHAKSSALMARGWNEFQGQNHEMMNGYNPQSQQQAAPSAHMSFAQLPALPASQMGGAGHNPSGGHWRWHQGPDATVPGAPVGMHGQQGSSNRGASAPQRARMRENSRGGAGGSGGQHFQSNAQQAGRPVSVENVLSGADRRTTLMIRNIPNKYTQRMMLEELNRSHAHKFDFFYLPIDFKNRCNKGYAFLNVIDPRSVVSLHREFHGEKWRNFKSDKQCAIYYAVIQGKSDMIERYQNSSVMQKDETCRPLIFYSDGPRQGLPQPFPSPVQIKKKRQQKPRTRRIAGTG